MILETRTADGERFLAIIQGTDKALYAITDAGLLYRTDRQDP